MRRRRSEGEEFSARRRAAAPRAAREKKTGLPRPRAARSFTLLEILIALAALTTAIVAVLGSIQHSLRMQSASIRATEATLLLRSKMEEVLADKELSEGSDSGSFERFSGYEWRSEVREAELPLFEDRETGLLDVKVTVTWNDRGKRELVASTLYRDRKMFR